MKKLLALLFTACCGLGAATAQSGALPPLDDAQVRHYLSIHPEHANSFMKGPKGEWSCSDPVVLKACISTVPQSSGPSFQAIDTAPTTVLPSTRREEPNFATNERKLASELRDRINADPANADRYRREHKELLQQRNAQNDSKH